MVEVTDEMMRELAKEVVHDELTQQGAPPLEDGKQRLTIALDVPEEFAAEATELITSYYLPRIQSGLYKAWKRTQEPDVKLWMPGDDL